MPEIRWRSANDESPSWRPLLPAPAKNLGFSEKGRYLFESPGSGWRLRIDDEPLTDGPEPGVWAWSPGFYAGEVVAELVQGANSAEFSLDVAPDSTKVGRDIFAAMVDELWKVNPALVIGDEPATRHIGDLGSCENPWLEFARYRRYVPEFLNAAIAVRARPRRTLRVERLLVPLHRVRRVDRQTAFALSRSATAGLLVGDEGSQAAISPKARLDVPVVEETLDSAANRTMLALGLALLRRGRSLSHRLGELVEREQDSETKTGLQARWPVRRQLLADLAAQLKALLRTSPFVDATRSEITAAGLTAIAADPGYSRAWNRGWRAMRHGVEASSITERLWMSPSWEIYERWCFLRLGELIAAEFPEWQWRLDDTALRPVWDDAAFRWSGSVGTKTASLAYQTSFQSMASGERPHSGRWSVSRMRKPDIVLTVRTADAGDSRFAVFDAKYRTTRSNVLHAMGTAHIYQDSLRLGERRPEATFLLVPSGGGAPWLEEAEYQRKHAVGVIPLSRNIEASLPAVVYSLLSL